MFRLWLFHDTVLRKTRDLLPQISGQFTSGFDEQGESENRFIGFSKCVRTASGAG
jgi:hypothetical protein